MTTIDDDSLWQRRGEIMAAGIRSNLQAAAAGRQQAAEEAARQVAAVDETDRAALWEARGRVLSSAMIERARVGNPAAASWALTEGARRDEEAAETRRAEVDRIVRDAVAEALRTTGIGEAAAKPSRSRKRPAPRSTVTEKYPGCGCLQGPDYSLVGCKHMADA